MIADDTAGAVLATLLINGRPPIDMRGPVTLGRDPHATVGETVVVDDDPLISKSHLSLDIDGDQIVVTDLGSSNGTFLHHATGETAVPSVAWVPVPIGAELEFGDQRMRIERTPPEHDDAPTPVGGVAAAFAEHDASIVCRRCRRELRADARFCDGCGTPTTPNVAQPPAGPASTVVVPAATAAAAVPPPVVPPGPPAPVVSPGPPAPVVPPGPLAPGGPVFVDLSADGGSSGRATKIVLAAVGAVVVAGVLGFVLSSVLGGDDGGRSDPLLVAIPDEVDELWSESVSGEASGAAADERGVYVASVDVGSGEVQVVAFDRSDGDELWDVELSESGSFVDASGTVDDVVVVTVCDEDCTVVALDRDNGDELWDTSIGDGFPTIIDHRLIGIDDGTVEAFDPATGDRIERVRGDDVTFSNGHVLVTDGDDIEVFDADLVRVLGPEPVDRADAVTFDGRRLIVAEGDELRFIDEDGTVEKESAVDVGLVETIQTVADDNIVLGSDEGVISVDPRDGVADERWSARGVLSSAVDVDGGPVVLVDDDGTVRVLDADSGDERFERELDQPDNGFPRPGSNLLVVYEFEDFDDPTELAAYDWVTGDEVWDERFDGFPGIRDGLVIELSRDGDVTVYG